MTEQFQQNSAALSAVVQAATLVDERTGTFTPLLPATAAILSASTAAILKYMKIWMFCRVRTWCIKACPPPMRRR
ncbi:MAG: hypothetical protein R2911_13710 [Caldilineaceae bacterium]